MPPGRSTRLCSVRSAAPESGAGLCRALPAAAGRSIERTATYSVDAFPSFEVYGATSGPELRLVTCGGTYSRSRRQYLANVVAFASRSG